MSPLSRKRKSRSKSAPPKNVLLGVTSSVACYKALSIASALRQRGHRVKTVLTPNAAKLISPALFNAVTKDEVFAESFAEGCFSPDHIALSRWADIFLIAPATANTLGKIASGVCDNLLTTLVVSRKCPLFVAPAMETGMWRNKIVRKNAEILKRLSIKIIPPAAGYLASGSSGTGRMEEPEKIIEKIGL
ncbi:MAG: hypothetical protein J7L54_02575 [Elusimicrobia bacterium]|nr:hypothetical protein [Elusimicrobiota bacterium]